MPLVDVVESLDEVDGELFALVLREIIVTGTDTREKLSALKFPISMRNLKEKSA